MLSAKTFAAASALCASNFAASSVSSIPSIWIASNAAFSAPLIATVAINGAENAALLAIQMLGIEDAELAAKLDAQRAEAAAKVLADSKKVEEQFNK